MMNYEQQFFPQERSQQALYEQEVHSGMQMELSRGHMEYPGYEIPTKSSHYPPVTPIGEGSILAAVLAYTFGWFSGLLFFLFAGQDRYVRFHALQSLLFFGALNLIDIVLFTGGIMMSRMPFFPRPGFLFFLLAIFVVQAIAIVGWVIGMFQAARGKYYQMPFVSNIALRASAQNAVVK